MGDNHISDRLYGANSPGAGELAQAMRRYTVWRRFRMASIGVLLFALAVSLVYLLWPDLRPISYWIAVIGNPVGLAGAGLAIAMTGLAREQLQRAQAGLSAVPASEPALYALLYAGLVLGGFLVSLGLPSAGIAWLAQWFASHHDKPVPAITSTGITMGLTAAIAGAGLLAISLGFYIKMRRNETRDGHHADGR